jgi:Flp pilus assembly protein TadG
VTLGDDRGNAATETVLLAPVVLVIVMFVVFTGRISSTDGDVAGAARDSARVASLARSPAAADAAARQTAADTLDANHVRCNTLAVDVDTTYFQRGGSVTVDVHCTVSLSDVIGLAVPGSATRSAHAVEVVDQYRGVS